MHHSKLKQLQIVLTPSWLSGLIVAVVWLVVTIGGLLSTHFTGSLWQKGLFHLGAQSGATYQQLTGRVSDNRFISNLPLLIFWLGMGLIVYYLAVGLYETFHQAVEIHEELDYVNVRRRELLRGVAEQVAVRLAATTVSVVYIAFFFKKLVPWTLAGLRQASAQPLHAVWVALALLAGLHAITVLARLMFLRARLFSSVVYD